jgi:signal transduction histidine kinase
VRRSLALKLTLAFLLVALTVALLVAVFIRLTSADQLNRLVVEQQRAELHTLLVNYYQTHGSWVDVTAYVQRSHGEAIETTQPGVNGPPGDADDNHPGVGHNQRQMFALADASGVVVMGAYPDFQPGYTVAGDLLAQGDPVVVKEKVVGTILTPKLRAGLNPEETAYLDRVTQALIFASGGAVLVALVVGLLLARTLTRPLQALTAASHRMASGELEQEVPVSSGDELGELAIAFNQMSRQVAQANKSRRQLTADIAHELRTPLTVIAGYIESMRDGVLLATPERFDVIYDEIEHLQHLVGDLRVLSQADAGELQLNRQPISTTELLQQAFATFQHQAEQKGIQLVLNLQPDLPLVDGDEVRLAQVLANLLANALRYTPAGGRISLGNRREGNTVAVTVADTGQGIPPDDLPFVFNRFYRADKSRSEESGESGLGLAIVKALVDAHGGTIGVDSTLGNGTTFTVNLPQAHA